jgi:hypothetical protein
MAYKCSFFNSIKFVEGAFIVYIPKFYLIIVLGTIDIISYTYS